MNSVELYYQVKNLFNTSREAFEIFYEYKSREHESFETVLCVCISRNESLYFFREAIKQTRCKIYDLNKRELYWKDKVVKFRSFDEIRNTKEYAGRRYNEIKFLS